MLHWPRCWEHLQRLESRLPEIWRIFTVLRRVQCGNSATNPEKARLRGNFYAGKALSERSPFT